MSGKIKIDSQEYAIKCLFSKNSTEEIISETKDYKNIFFEIKTDNTIVGYFFPHEEFLNIVKNGKQKYYQENRGAIRSLFLITDKSAIKSSKLLDENDDWLETRLDSEYLNNIRQQIIYLSDIDKKQNSKVFLNYLYHVLTHGEKAEKIWKLIGDNLSNHLTFNHIPSDASFQDSSNKDGGIDDLRETRFGLMATQVKGGKVYTGTVVDSETVANNFFITNDPNKFSDRARRKRIKKWSFLARPFMVPQIENNSTINIKHADDALLIHYLAIGKNCPRDLTQKGYSASWPTEPPHREDERFLFVTGLDIIVINRGDTITTLDTTMTSQDGYLFLKGIINSLNQYG